MFSILIVDDNPFDRECIKKLVDWDALGIEVCGVASNGLEGYRCAVGLKPDFILTDIAMPVMDGLEMTEKIRAELPDARFIFMSCHDEFDFAKAAIDLEVSSYVLKPVDMEELVQAVLKVSESRRSEMEARRYQEELKQQIKCNLPILQEDMVRDLIQGRTGSAPEIAERLNYLDMPVKSRYIITLLQIDNYQLNFGEATIEEKYLTIYSIKNIIGESLLKHTPGYMLVLDYSNLCILLPGEWDSQEEALEVLMSRMEDCRAQINKALGINVTMGISNLSSDLGNMPRIFSEAEYAVKSKFYSKGNRIMLASDIASPEDDPELDFAALKKEIGQLLDRASKNEAEPLLDKYYSRDAHYSETYTKSLCYSILLSVQMLLAEKKESLGSVFGNESVIWDKLSKFETILDIKQWLVNILSAVLEHMEDRQGNRHQNIVQDIKGIMDREYAKLQNIRQVADRLYISAGYANFLFKQETGITMGDYLFEKRMEAAKLLLQDPYCKIYEIADRVGYVSKSYFGAVFKEYVGMTPREYRDKYCK